MKPKDIRFYLEELKSNECRCGAWKQQRKTFCYVCFKSLPDDIQKALYRRIGDGYEEAREEAEKFLQD